MPTNFDKETYYPNDILKLQNSDFMGAVRRDSKTFPNEEPTFKFDLEKLNNLSSSNKEMSPEDMACLNLALSYQNVTNKAYLAHLEPVHAVNPGEVPVVRGLYYSQGPYAIGTSLKFDQENVIKRLRPDYYVKDLQRKDKQELLAAHKRLTTAYAHMDPKKIHSAAIEFLIRASESSQIDNISGSYQSIPTFAEFSSFVEKYHLDTRTQQKENTFENLEETAQPQIQTPISETAHDQSQPLKEPSTDNNQDKEEGRKISDVTEETSEPIVPLREEEETNSAKEEEKADTVTPPEDADGTTENPENDRHDEMDLPEEVLLYLKNNNISLDEYKQNKEEIDAKIKKVQETEKEPKVEQQDKDDERKVTENKETPEWAKEEALLYDNMTTKTEPDGTKSRLYNVESINYDNGDFARKFSRNADGTEGFILNLNKENPSHVSIRGLGDDGIPSIEDFKVMARAEKEKAQRNGDTPNINLGKIKDPEFKARLMIAMMEEGVKINNAPKPEELKISKENSVPMSAETEKRLQKLVAPEKEKEVNEEQKPLVVSQDRIDGEKISRLRGLAIASKAIKMDDKQYEALKEENKNLFSQEQVELMDKIRLKEDSENYKNLSEEDKKKVEEAKKGINDLANNAERNKILEARGIIRAARKAGNDKSSAPKQEEIDKSRNIIKARQMSFKDVGRH